MLATERPRTELQPLFEHLAAEWHRDTDLLSDSTRAAMHPAYQRIIGLGPQILPLIFNELRTHGGHWFWALRAITGENPVPAEMAGKVDVMRNAWLAWGKKEGYLGDNGSS